MMFCCKPACVRTTSQSIYIYICHFDMASGCLSYHYVFCHFPVLGSAFFGALPGMVLASRQLQGQASLRKWKNSSEGNGARSLAGKLCDTRATDGQVPSRSKQEVAHRTPLNSSCDLFQVKGCSMYEDETRRNS